jgi:HNH endonuclease
MGRPIKHLPSAEYLRECFDYDPSTGVLSWKTRPREHFAKEGEWTRWNILFAGVRAETKGGGGYIVVRIKHRRYLAHRIIWKLTTGAEPPLEIDHKDRNRTNNRVTNLRAATDSEQNWNSKIRKTNTSGRRGVSWQNGRWKTSIYTGGIKRHLGYFATVDEASIAYEIVARELHGEFYQQSQGG